MEQLYHFNPSESREFPGLSVVGFDENENPLENLKIFARSNLCDELITQVETFTARILKSMEYNHPVDLRSGTLIKSAPEKHRAALSALLQDIPIFLLRHRYNLLRGVFDNQPVRWNELLERYWLGGVWHADPDMPRVAARVIVARASQWQLMCRLHDILTEVYQSFERADDDDLARHESLRRLARVISFLCWVPYQWVEDVLLDIVEKVTSLSGRDRLRLWVSVLRSFFCRRRIEPESVKTLLDKILGEFGGRVPMDFQTPLRAIIVSSGRAIIVRLQEILTETDRYDLRRMLLDCCAVMDKKLTAQFVKNSPEVFESLKPPDRIHLLRLIGYCDGWVISKLADINEKADERTQILLLRFVEDFRCSHACDFLMESLHKLDLQMRLRTYTTVGRVGPIEMITEILDEASAMEPILYIRIVQMIHYRITESPSVLVSLSVLSPLYYLQRAREDLYTAYRDVYKIRNFLKENIDKDKVEIDSSIIENKRKRLSWMDELLRYAHLEAGYYNDNVVSDEGSYHVYDGVLRQLLSGEHDHSFKPTQLLSRLDTTLSVTRDSFLLKEWFVRPAPFTLSECMPEMIEKILRGEELNFSSESYQDTSVEKRIKHTFSVFLECTKHGIYVTDHILDTIMNRESGSVSENVNNLLMSRRSRVSLGETTFDPFDKLDCHVQFSTFAHIYRYGKESIHRPSITRVWLRYIEAIQSLKRKTAGNGSWPSLSQHPDMQTVMGPRVTDMYARQIEETEKFLEFLKQVRDLHPDVEIRVIPNITYGLFCLSPVIDRIYDLGIQVSLAGISSRFCDDVNISEFALRHDSLFPVKPHLFSTAGNYGTQHKDRILIVVDGTMEPLDRHYPQKIRLPKAHRGYINHLAAINFIRSAYGYLMRDPIRETASALSVSERYVRNLIHTARFKQLVEYLRLSFDACELHQYQNLHDRGRTYYSFAQWNPDGLTAVSGSRGDVIRDVPCARPDTVEEPVLLFASMNGVVEDKSIPAYFDNNPEVERSRIILGPRGAWLDTGWPHTGKGIVVSFPEGQNA